MSLHFPATKDLIEGLEGLKQDASQLQILQDLNGIFELVRRELTQSLMAFLQGKIETIDTNGFSADTEEKLGIIEENLYQQYLRLTQHYQIKGFTRIEAAIPWDFVNEWFYSLPYIAQKRITSFNNDLQLLFIPPCNSTDEYTSLSYTSFCNRTTIFGHPEVHNAWNNIQSPSDNWRIALTTLEDNYRAGANMRKKNDDNQIFLAASQRELHGYGIGTMPAYGYLPSVLAASLLGKQFDTKGYTVFPEQTVSYILTEPTSPKDLRQGMLAATCDTYTFQNRPRSTTLLTSIHPDHYTENVGVRPWIEIEVR